VFGLSLAELTVVAVVALVLLGPDKLPQVMRLVARGYAQLAKLKYEFSKAMDSAMAPLAPLDPKNWSKEINKIVPELSEIGKEAAEAAAGVRAAAEVADRMAAELKAAAKPAGSNADASSEKDTSSE
jgi:sec-independent protein translocase protein TatB